MANKIISKILPPLNLGDQNYSLNPGAKRKYCVEHRPSSRGDILEDDDGDSTEGKELEDVAAALVESWIDEDQWVSEDEDEIITEKDLALAALIREKQCNPRKKKSERNAYYQAFHDTDSGLDDDDMDGPGWERRYQEFLKKTRKEEPTRRPGQNDPVFEEYVRARLDALEETGTDAERSNSESEVKMQRTARRNKKKQKPTFRKLRKHPPIRRMDKHQPNISQRLRKEPSSSTPNNTYWNWLWSKLDELKNCNPFLRIYHTLRKWWSSCFSTKVYEAND